MENCNDLSENSSMTFLIFGAGTSLTSKYLGSSRYWMAKNSRTNLISMALCTGSTFCDINITPFCCVRIWLWVSLTTHVYTHIKLNWGLNACAIREAMCCCWKVLLAQNFLNSGIFLMTMSTLYRRSLDEYKGLKFPYEKCGYSLLLSYHCISYSFCPIDMIG